jgi:hypothetical protein
MSANLPDRMVAYVEMRANAELAQSEEHKGRGQHYKAREAAHTSRVLRQTADYLRHLAARGEAD